ncbi:4Fe-4S dicluster domain-containing protein [uncultured Flavonifractor sp.]|uniref:4Fe-4S dicluster domain-containing protein n=1 Tax=uncultured Flavonifractor sp. TaxID=1193534 RepID=UPI00263601CF|nr:4Fe-4S dicluster domain-containing protein [uncultured Flavonifractor sp.]
MNLTEAVKAAGVVGAGGAGFPTHVKLSAKAECFLVNAAECEPLIETDKYLCRTFPDRIVAATAAVSAHLGAKRAVIALKGKYQAEISALEEAIRRLRAEVEIFPMKTFYPAGDEQTMVEQVTGRSVPERGLPLDVGCVVDNVGTLLNIMDALEGRPVTHKYLSVVGEVKEPVMLYVPIGTPLTQCVAAASPTIGKYALIVGGPMMGKVLTEPAAMEEAVVTKTTGNLIVLPPDHYLFRRAALSMDAIRHQAKSACIQCRMCTDLCPRYLIGHQIRPHLMMRNLWREKGVEDNEAYLATFGDAANCCDCGVCEMFACPMGLSPRKVNSYLKGELRSRGIQVPRNMEPHAREFADARKTPTDRLIARLGLAAYNGLHAHSCITLEPERVCIPMQQHIGKPALPVKAVGERVACGELLGQAAEGLSANIHASMDGVVEEITPAGVWLRRKEVESA